MISCSTFYRNYVSALYRIRDTKVIAPRTEDRGRITKQPSVCFPMSIGGLEQKCFQLTMTSSGRPQQLQLCRQRVPCSRCGDRESRVADSSTCPRHDEVARRRSTQCRSSGYMGNCKSDMYTGVCSRSDLCTIRQNLYWILSATGNLCNSWRTGITYGRAIQNSTCRGGGVEDSLILCQCGS